MYECEQEENPVLEISSSMDIGEHPACNRGFTYIFSNADSVKMYKNDNFIKEYKPKDEIWLTAKYYSKEVDGKYYKGFIVREIITEQEIEKASEELLDDLPF